MIKPMGFGPRGSTWAGKLNKVVPTVSQAGNNQIGVVFFLFKGSSPKRGNAYHRTIKKN